MADFSESQLQTPTKTEPEQEVATDKDPEDTPSPGLVDSTLSPDLSRGLVVESASTNNSNASLNNKIGEAINDMDEKRDVAVMLLNAIHNHAFCSNSFMKPHLTFLRGFIEKASITMSKGDCLVIGPDGITSQQSDDFLKFKSEHRAVSNMFDHIEGKIEPLAKRVTGDKTFRKVDYTPTKDESDSCCAPATKRARSSSWP